MALHVLLAGWVGFDKDMGATRTLAADSAGDAMDATAAGMEEIEMRTKDPLRMYRIWRKVGAGTVFILAVEMWGRPLSCSGKVLFFELVAHMPADIVSASAKARGS